MRVTDWSLRVIKDDKKWINFILFSILILYFVFLWNLSRLDRKLLEAICEECSDGRNSGSENKQIESKHDLFENEEIKSDYSYDVDDEEEKNILNAVQKIFIRFEKWEWSKYPEYWSDSWWNCLATNNKRPNKWKTIT